MNARKMMCLFMLVVLALAASSACAMTAHAQTAQPQDSQMGTATLYLDANATTGYSWQVAIQGEDVVKLADESYIAPEPSDMVGVGGTQMFLFEALKPGAATITLTYAQPWDTGAQPAYTLTYRAQVDKDNQLILIWVPSET